MMQQEIFLRPPRISQSLASIAPRPDAVDSLRFSRSSSSTSQPLNTASSMSNSTHPFDPNERTTDTTSSPITNTVHLNSSDSESRPEPEIDTFGFRRKRSTGPAKIEHSSPPPPSVSPPPRTNNCVIDNPLLLRTANPLILESRLGQKGADNTVGIGGAYSAHRMPSSNIVKRNGSPFISPIGSDKSDDSDLLPPLPISLPLFSEQQLTSSLKTPPIPFQSDVQPDLTPYREVSPIQTELQDPTAAKSVDIDIAGSPNPSMPAVHLNSFPSPPSSYVPSPFESPSIPACITPGPTSPIPSLGEPSTAPGLDSDLPPFEPQLNPAHVLPDLYGAPDDGLFTNAGGLPTRLSRKPLMQEPSASTTTGTSVLSNIKATMSTKRRTRLLMRDGEVRGAPDRTAVDVTDWTEDCEQSGCHCVVQ